MKDYSIIKGSTQSNFFVIGKGHGLILAMRAIYEPGSYGDKASKAGMRIRIQSDPEDSVGIDPSLVAKQAFPEVQYHGRSSIHVSTVCAVTIGRTFFVPAQIPGLMEVLTDSGTVSLWYAKLQHYFPGVEWVLDSDEELGSLIQNSLTEQFEFPQEEEGKPIKVTTRHTFLGEDWDDEGSDHSVVAAAVGL